MIAPQAKKAILFLLVSLALFGCNTAPATTDDAIKIEKENAEVKMVPFTPADQKGKKNARPKDSAEADVDGYTEWFYSCKADLQTENVFHDDTLEACSMALKVKGINFKLALPITLHLPAGAKPDLVKHEEGHAQICAIIYGRADDACREAAKEVVGKTFNGMGKTPEEARTMALAQAQHIIAQVYQDGTANLVDQASQKYEELCRQYVNDAKISPLDLARQSCARVLDIPIKVIK